MSTETTSTQSTGNTRPVLRARAYQITLNQIEHYDKVFEYLNSLKSTDYILSCKETAPTTGHEHIHIYVHFSNARSLSIKKMCGAHIEICRGSPQQNIAYIRKDGNILDEVGTEPHQGFHTVKELKEIDNPDDLNWNEYNTWQKIKQAPKKMKKSEWNKDVKIYYIWGPSGIGKSTKAHEMCDDEFEEVKHKGDFYLGVVDGTGCCIYDDFRDTHMSASEFINFIDYRIHNMNVKGGCIKNKYNKIIITSIQNPKRIYRNVNEEQREQWLRRMEIIDMNPEEESDDDI